MKVVNLNLDDLETHKEQLKSHIPYIKKHTEKNKSRRFLYIRQDFMYEAMNQLSGDAFKLYLYCYSHFHNETFNHDIAEVMVRIGVSDFSYVDAIDQLVTAGCLYPDEHLSGMYHFFPRPVSSADDAQRYMELCDASWATN